MPAKSFTYFIKIFGCQMNYADAEIIASTLAERGGKPTLNQSKAGLIVAVTCGVRASAEQRVISWVKKARNQNEKSVIVLTGCLSHRRDIETRLKDVVDLFVPIEDWLNRYSEILVGTRRGAFLQDNFYHILPKRSSSFQAYIPIMTGCNNFCSYCVVPFARGREKSQPPERILAEAKNLVKRGYKELYLLGQNVNSYRGVDKNGDTWSFSRLLGTIDKIPGDFWIRFISSHPKDITSDMIKTLAKCRKVSPNLHLPIQSGSNRILRAMNRGYTREDYLNLISKIRKDSPNVVFSTDIIVGFPGETDEDFQDSLDMVRKVGFEMLFSLKYSPRPETAALKLKDDVPPQEKQKRQRKLDETWKNIAERKNQRFVGKTVTILVDRTKTKTDNNGKIKHYVLGKSFDNKDVLAEIKRIEINPTGQWAAVKIKKAEALALQGELVRVKKKV